MGVTTTVLILSSTAAQTTLSAPLFTSKSPSSKKEIGIIAQRGFILAHLCVLPMIVVWWFIRPIMIALGQPASLAIGLESFLRWMLLYIPGYGQSPRVLSLFFVSQGLTMYPDPHFGSYPQP